MRSSQMNKCMSMNVSRQQQKLSDNIVKRPWQGWISSSICIELLLLLLYMWNLFSSGRATK